MFLSKKNAFLTAGKKRTAKGHYLVSGIWKEKIHIGFGGLILEGFFGQCFPFAKETQSSISKSELIFD